MMTRQTLVYRLGSAGLGSTLAFALIGCAGGPQSSGAPSEDAEPVAFTAPDAYQEVDPSAPYHMSPAAGADEYVIGVAYDDAGLPLYETPVAELSLDQIAAELAAMRELDHELVRDATGLYSREPSEVERVRAIDQAQCARLKEIVAAIGWPTREQVGVDAAQGAFVVIQHAGHDQAFQNECLSLMVDLVEEGKLAAPYVALLTDRVRMFAGGEQVFGTQMTFQKNEAGVVVPTPTVAIENPAELNARRSVMGMPPHEVFVARLSEALSAQSGSYASVSTEGFVED